MSPTATADDAPLDDVPLDDVPLDDVPLDDAPLYDVPLYDVPLDDVTADDVTAVTVLLGRPPQGDFEVVVRDDQGQPVVIRNAPLLGDGTPMPTRYWLVHAELRRQVSGLESSGGVRAAEAAVDPVELALVHQRHAAERDAALPPDHVGPRPSGGVGGTRQGVKCLHAHYAWHLAGGDDPVGRWVGMRLTELQNQA